MNLREAIRNLFRAATVDEKELDKREALSTGQIFKHSTYQKRGGKRHRSYTKAAHDPIKAKVRRKMAAKSRRINRGK